jgi:predicted nuclease of restriction endonuclease-like (RecB) superfamily
MGKIKTNKEFEQIAILIEEARNRAFHKVNEELVLLYFKVGNIVSAKVADGAWGDNTVDELASYIESKNPGLKGFNRRGLYRMKQFFETYTAPEFVSPLATQLEAYFAGNKGAAKVSAVPTQMETAKSNKKVSAVPTPSEELEVLQEKLVALLLCKVTWSNHLEILSQTKTPEEKFFYLLHCIKEKWSMRDLRRQLSSAYFERTMLSDKKVSTLLTQLPQNLFKDPYIFEFLDLPDGHSEKDLEKSLILNLQKFILEIGKGFTYMGNQYRLQVGNKDYHTDLLFYHRDLQCLVLFELKIQEFEPEFLGKLNFYLEALDRDVKRPFENNSVGVLLCKGKDTEVVEYAMARNTSPAMIADYETKLIPKNVLANKLHQLVEQLSKEENG